MRRIIDEDTLENIPLGRFDRFMQRLLRVAPIQPKRPKKDNIQIGGVLKYYVREAKKYPYAVTLTLTQVIVATVAGITTPYIFKQFVDMLSQGGDNIQAIYRLVILFSVVGVVQWFAWRTTYITMGYIAANAIQSLRETAFTHLIAHSQRFFSNSFTGSLVQRVNRFAVSYDRLADRLVFDIVPVIIQLLGIGVVLYHVEPRIAYIILFWLIIFVGWNWVFALWKLKYDVARAAADSAATAGLADAITNHPTIDLYYSHKREIAKYHDATGTQANLARFSWQASSIVDAVQALSIIVAEFIVLYVGVTLWSKGTLSVGSLILAQTYMLMLSQQLWGFSRIIRDIYEAFADAKEMVEILETPHEIIDGTEHLDITAVKGEIEFQNVSFSFQEKPVIEKLSLRIAAGEKVALVGLSGAGKSTVVKLLFRQYDPQDGRVLIDGEDIKQLKLSNLRDTLSLVPQDPVLFHRSLKQNIGYGKPGASDGQIELSAQLAHAEDFILASPSGYDTLVGERGVKLSGGERQRIAIARAFLKNSPILVLDEATSSLDSHSEMLIQDALDTLMKNRTTIVIAHRLSTIRKMDRIIVLDNGAVVEDGSHERLLRKKGIYAKLWNIQQGGFVKDEEEEDEEVRN